MIFSELDEHTIAGTIKQFLRELPDPLMTSTLFGEFIRVIEDVSFFQHPNI